MENTLLANIINAINIHIDARVTETVNKLIDKRIEEIVGNHHTMQWMNEDFERRVREISQDVADDAAQIAVSEHERHNNHEDEDNNHDMVQSAIANTDFEDHIKHSVHQILNDDDYVDESRAEEIANNAIEEIDWDEKIKDGLRSIIANS